MRIEDYSYYYFLGIGGIGMSALARYFKCNGKEVAGYDKTETALTLELVREGIGVHFDDNIHQIPSRFIEGKEHTLVIYTPAVPKDLGEFSWLTNEGFAMKKRAVVLGEIFREAKGIAVAGTHGKTTVSTMVGHLLKSAAVSSSAFLGGISKNYSTNLLLTPNPQYIVAEADEFDRSFLNLWPHLALVTATDADHLDIYGSHEEVKNAFADFTRQVKPGGSLVLKKEISLPVQDGVSVFHYSIDTSTSFGAANIVNTLNGHTFDFVTPRGTLKDFTINLPGLVNVENAVGALSLAWLAGADEEYLRVGIASFKGVKRRFDIQINIPGITMVDDYGHHPEEVKAFIQSMRSMFPGRKLTGIFQPHLFSRTRDFAAEFAESLSALDELILLEIYPARELPLEGVTSEIIFKAVTCEKKSMCRKEELLGLVNNGSFDVLATMGAGDIDTFVLPIRNLLEAKFKGGMV